MLLSRSSTLIVPALIAVLASAQTSSTLVTPTTDREQLAERINPQDAPPSSCQVTLPSAGSFVPPSPAPAGPAAQFGLAADRFWFGTEKLWTVLPTNGTWRGSVPSKPGDFSYSDKLPWFRLHPAFSEKDGPLTITGKRLDGPAPSFTETFESNAFSRDDDNAMIMGGINIPVFGCWQVTGHYQDQELSFTVWVTPLPEQKPSSGASSPTISQVPSAQETEPRRIRVDGKTQARSLVYKVTPEIPPGADAANVSGTVVLHAIITKDGRADELQYVSGPPLLAQAAIDAVTWWQYWVRTVNDEPVEVDTTIDVVFPPPGH